MSARPPGWTPKHARSFRVEIRWTHQRYGPEKQVLTIEATNIRRAINTALQIFFAPRCTPGEVARLRAIKRGAYNELTVHALRRPKEKP